MSKTNFDPSTNGFAFENRWTIDPNMSDLYGQMLVGAIAGALAALGPVVGNRLVLNGLSMMLGDMIVKALPPALQVYGLCGGMAFAALDCYSADPPVEAATMALSPELRSYFEKRQLDSLRANLPQVLAWMATLHLIHPGWGMNGGAYWLLQQSKTQWQVLKDRLDNAQPTPLSLIGETTNPMHNHQVLAYDYDEPDPADGTGVIFIYDMNCSGGGSTIELNFNGSVLSANESCYNPDRGHLRGFICEEYQEPTVDLATALALPAPGPSQ